MDGQLYCLSNKRPHTPRLAGLVRESQTEPGWRDFVYLVLHRVGLSIPFRGVLLAKLCETSLVRRPGTEGLAHIGRRRFEYPLQRGSARLQWATAGLFRFTHYIYGTDLGRVLVHCPCSRREAGFVLRVGTACHPMKLPVYEVFAKPGPCLVVRVRSRNGSRMFYCTQRSTKHPTVGHFFHRRSRAYIRGSRNGVASAPGVVVGPASASGVVVGPASDAACTAVHKKGISLPRQ
jgi:hypothetical protein